MPKCLDASCSGIVVDGECNKCHIKQGQDLAEIKKEIEEINKRYYV